MYYYNATTGQSSWERPADMGRKPGGGGGGGGGKSKGPPGANLFVACKGSTYLGDEQLRQAFEPYGQVLRAEMTVDKDTGVSKGFGFVSYTDPHMADAAMAALNGQLVGDKQIRIEKTNT
jgi:CUG-BP- and ETR3-like factor